MRSLMVFFALVCFCLFPLTTNAANYGEFYSPSFAEGEVRFIFLGSSAVIVNASQGTVLIDPASILEDHDIEQLKSGGLDLVLYTHSHGDHYYSRAAEEIIKATGAQVVAEPLAANGLSFREIPPEKITAGLPGKTYVFGDIAVEVVKGDHLGPINLYRIKIGDICVFHGGDSGYVPLKAYPSDVAFLPTGSPSPTCSPEDAFKMAADLKPGVAVAMHGMENEHAAFEALIREKMPNTTAIIPMRGVTRKVVVKK